MVDGGVRGLVGLVAVLVGVAVLSFVPSSAAVQHAPDGYWAYGERVLVRDVVTYGLVRDRTHNLRVASVGPDAGVRMTAGLALDRLTAAETTSSMCRRTGCLLAVNGDFFDLRTTQPVGGMVIDGILVRSPVPDHPQLVITEDGRWQAGALDWTGHLDPVLPESDDDASLLPGLPDEGDEDDEGEEERAQDPDEPVAVVGVNTPPAPDDVVAYTSRYNDTTLTTPEWTELTVRLAEPLRPHGWQVVEPVHLSREAGNSPIPPDGAVFAGRGDGAEALERLWRDAEEGRIREIRFVSDVSIDGITTSLGGGPMVMRQGRYVGGDGALAAWRHPRTLVGWNDRGERWLVTVDGRQPRHSRGMTLHEASDVLGDLGATEVLNLDGGGSTTFVQQGEVVNRPVHGGRAGRERPVANALLALATAPILPPSAPEVPSEPLEVPTEPPAAGPQAPAPREAPPEPGATRSSEPEPSPEAPILAAPSGSSPPPPEEGEGGRGALAVGAVVALAAALVSARRGADLHR